LPSALFELWRPCARLASHVGFAPAASAIAKGAIWVITVILSAAAALVVSR